MRRLESIHDELKGIVTYELSDGRRVCLSARAVRKYGAAAILRAEGLGHLVPTERAPVFHHGGIVGTLPGDFDPGNIRSLSFLYDPRPGEFRREGAAWIASPTLGPGDLDAVPGFIRQAQNQAQEQRCSPSIWPGNACEIGITRNGKGTQ